MNTMKFAAVVIVGCCALGAADAVLAHGVNARQTAQHERIERGVAQGDLTRREVVTLQHRQAHIARTEAWMRRDDGLLGAMERLRLDARQDRASVAIRHQRDDTQRR